MAVVDLSPIKDVVDLTVVKEKASEVAEKATNIAASAASGVASAAGSVADAAGGVSGAADTVAHGATKASERGDEVAAMASEAFTEKSHKMRAVILIVAGAAIGAIVFVQIRKRRSAADDQDSSARDQDNSADAQGN